MKRLSIDIPANLHRRLKLARIEGERAISDEVLALIERHVAELETTAAMERFTAVDREHGMALGAFVREREGRAKER
jgi:hypothetical protein